MELSFAERYGKCSLKEAYNSNLDISKNWKYAYNYHNFWRVHPRIGHRFTVKASAGRKLHKSGKLS